MFFNFRFLICVFYVYLLWPVRVLSVGRKNKNGYENHFSKPPNFEEIYLKMGKKCPRKYQNVPYPDNSILKSVSRSDFPFLGELKCKCILYSKTPIYRGIKRKRKPAANHIGFAVNRDFVYLSLLIYKA